MPDESRVKPQPLQPEDRGSCCPRKDCPTCRGACDELTDAGKLAIYPKLLEQLDAKDETIRDLIATIEEARREQPVRNDALADECAKASYETYDDGQDDYSDLFRRAAKALRDPHTVSLPANAREQPVRVTDADEAGRVFAKDYSEANFSEPEEREAHRLTAIDGFDQGIQYSRSRDDYMSAPRTNAAIADELKRILDKPAEVFDGYLRIVWDPEDYEAIMEAAAALRKEPPALPAEVEAVLAKLWGECEHFWHDGDCRAAFHDSSDDCLPCIAATLLRRYAQSVAEKDAKLQAIEALTSPPDEAQVDAALRGFVNDRGWHSTPEQMRVALNAAHRVRVKGTT